ncbi:MAG: DUF2520 domain-containing protein [Syntrophotaleaceae bacterium]
MRQFKTIYHAAAVMVCNYLTSLIEIGTQTYLKAGLDRETALQLMEPMVRGTVENIFNSGTVRALTGPIARGDHALVSKQLAALSAWNPRFANLYRDLGVTALELSRLQGTAPRDALATLAELLEKQTEEKSVSLGKDRMKLFRCLLPLILFLLIVPGLTQGPATASGSAFFRLTR